MAPGALVQDPPTEVVFHAGKGTQSRPILHGAAMKPTFSTIPTVDFRLATSPHLPDRLAVAAQVAQAFTTVGFLYALNTGVASSPTLQATTTAAVKAFFARPHDEKMRIHINNSPAIKGYEALLETRLDASTRGDLKEAWNMADDPSEPEQNAPPGLDMSDYPLPPPLNQYPEQPEGFREAMHAYRAAALTFSLTLLRLIALSLDLDEHHFDHMTSFPMAGLRALHYPPQPASDPNAVGIGAHADYSLFTLVNQLSPSSSSSSSSPDSEAALQVLNANGHWVPAPPMEGSLVVNVGDFLERITNDRFVSTVHRVRNCGGEARYSLAYFFSPSADVMITTAPSCLGREGEGKMKYEDVRAGEWQRERLLRARVNHPASQAARERGDI